MKSSYSLTVFLSRLSLTPSVCYSFYFALYAKPIPLPHVRQRESEDKITTDEENTNRSVNPPTMTGKKDSLGKKKKKNSAAVILPFKLKLIFKDVKLNYYQMTL